jgi:hypothetical protein
LNSLQSDRFGVSLNRVRKVSRARASLALATVTVPARRDAPQNVRFHAVAQPIRLPPICVCRSAQMLGGKQDAMIVFEFHPIRVLKFNRIGNRP